MPQNKVFNPVTMPRDLMAGAVVFLVVLPVCLGVAQTSQAPIISGLLAAIVGGLVVGLISRSHTSVSGPTAGLTVIVASQIVALGGNFEAFLLAVVLAGLLQIGLGVARAGFFAAFFPSSVIKGLLAAVGVILILKQIPHIFGHDNAPEGEMSFLQINNENTISELLGILEGIHPGATLVGLTCVAILLAWDWNHRLRTSKIPGLLVVVGVGVVLSLLCRQIGGAWEISGNHLVQVPVAASWGDVRQFLRFPDFSQWNNPLVYWAALLIALVASLETLLNLEAIDRIDPKQRKSPSSRELLAQGTGNLCCGLIGGIPITSVLVNSSVNVHARAQTKLSALTHGGLLLVGAVLLPGYLNMIPISCLAAILLITGMKLASPQLFRQMWLDGRYQFVPFLVTVLAIVFTDLLTGILIGLGISISFILASNFRHPIRRILEQHLGGEVLHIELANQVSFFKKAGLEKVLDEIPRGGHVLIDAQSSVYIDPDVLELIRTFTEQRAPARGVEVSLKGFRSRYQLQDRIQYADYSNRELQEQATPQQVLRILKDGHRRFKSGDRLNRDMARQVNATALGQHPLAVVLACIDSRAPAELIFDLGVGDIFSVRVAGNITTRKVLGSIEYATAVAGAKLILVMGHSRCGAVSTAVKLINVEGSAAELTGCQHIDYVLNDIQSVLNPSDYTQLDTLTEAEQEQLINEAAKLNILNSIRRLTDESDTLRKLVESGQVAIVGAMYYVSSGDIEYLNEEADEEASTEPRYA